MSTSSILMQNGIQNKMADNLSNYISWDENSTGIGLPDSKTLFLDPAKRRKRDQEKSGEWLLRKRDSTGLLDLENIITENLISSVHQAMKKHNTSAITVNISNPEAYLELRFENNEKLREVESKLDKIQAKFSLYKYYTFVWVFSAFLAGLFALSGSVGLLDFFPSATGVFFTIGGMVGAYIDWKDKEKKYDS